MLVKNLPYDATPAELYALFGPYGAISEVRKGNTSTTRGTCLVVYSTSKAAKTAHEKLQGVNFKGRYVTALMYSVDRSKVKGDELETRKATLLKLKEEYGIE